LQQNKKRRKPKVKSVTPKIEKTSVENFFFQKLERT